MDDLARFLSAAFFLTLWALVAAVTALVALRVRRLPREVVQLRLFQRHASLSWALVLIGIGASLNFLQPVPFLLGSPASAEYHNALGAVTSVLIAAGFVALARIFWFPIRRGRG